MGESCKISFVNHLMGFYGTAAAIAILMQQSLLLLQEMAFPRSAKQGVWEQVAAGSANAMYSVFSVFAAVVLAALPLVWTCRLYMCLVL
jgi:hypothetical protein